MQPQSELTPGALATKHGSPLRRDHVTTAMTRYASRKVLNRPPDHMTSGGHAWLSRGDIARWNKDFGASWTLGRGQQAPSDRVIDFDCRQRVQGGLWRIGFSQACSNRTPAPGTHECFPLPASRPAAALQPCMSVMVLRRAISGSVPAVPFAAAICLPASAGRQLGPARGSHSERSLPLGGQPRRLIQPSLEWHAQVRVSARDHAHVQPSPPWRGDP